MSNPASSDEPKKESRYVQILVHIFEAHYTENCKSFEFERSEIESAATALGVVLPKNLGDLLYSFRFRTKLPDVITRTATEGFHWNIEGAGRSRYRMILRKVNRIVPNSSHLKIKIPDATPEIVTAWALSDEQALLAKVRYNRLIDIFLRVTAYSIQNHLRTSMQEIGQIEVDEIYVAVNNTGRQFVIPVQAKGGSDQINTTQVSQDLALCRAKFPLLTARPVAVQFVRDETGETIVMFELIEREGELLVVDEKHYRLVPAIEIGTDDLDQYGRG